VHDGDMDEVLYRYLERMKLVKDPQTLQDYLIVAVVVRHETSTPFRPTATLHRLRFHIFTYLVFIHANTICGLSSVNCLWRAYVQTTENINHFNRSRISCIQDLRLHGVITSSHTLSPSTLISTTICELMLDRCT
jgi:hypothetical protein